MEYYSALKKKEILFYGTLWMAPEDILLSEVSQSQKDKYCMIPYLRYLKKSNSEREIRMIVSGGMGGSGGLKVVH